MPQRLPDPDTESAFIQHIDCNFPYRNPLQWRPLVSRAARLSPNAAFMVVHEVCRLPSSVQLSLRERQAILNHLLRRFRHPLVRDLKPVMDAWLEEHRLTVGPRHPPDAPGGAVPGPVQRPGAVLLPL